jgi:hypothetical protein
VAYPPADPAHLTTFLTPAPQPPTEQHTSPSLYLLQSIACPTHGLQTVLIGSHEQRGTTYADGSFDTRWHEQAGCGCHFDVWYYHVHPVSRTADSVTVVYVAA